ncbi:response regulator [Cohnella caldifontis]|uniref:response regulator n=1 Tax=Cohnella caldifontis TaxID=3027471 RepID=UPI0023EA7999|nr:response regulator [Cohnella sp. YIM B05605]
MTKLLVVDDEQIEREGLVAILRRGISGLDIEQAKNGKVAVSVAERFRPDLVLMDIKMPGMNGLEAIERIGAADPDVKFIMVTAYDTFDFARQAIKLGVKDYLLKPSKAADIVDTVSRVLREIEAEKRTREASRQQSNALRKVLPVVETDIVTQLLFDHVHDVHLDELVGLLGVSTENEKFAMVVLTPSGSEQSYLSVKAKVRRMGIGWIGALYGRQIPIIAFRDPGQSFRSQAVAAARELLAAAPSGEGQGWFVGIGNACASLDQIRRSYREAQIAAIEPTLPVKYRLYADMPALGPVREGREARQWEKRFVEKIRLGLWNEVRADVLEFIRRCENEGADLLLSQQRALELLWLVSRMMAELGMEAEKPLFSFRSQDYRQLRAEAGLLLDRMRQAFEEHQAGIGPDAIRRIRQYIAEHSHEDISLEAIGKRVGLSPFYISKMFKDQFGVNYIDFLTECRIEKAKKLMADPGKSLKEITFEVGYNDPNYFSKVFKKTCEVSPTEYRKALLGKKGQAVRDA